MLGFDRITFDPNVMGGQACIRGMRVTVSLILNLVADGMSTEEIIEAYPAVEPEDIHQALHYAARMTEDAVRSDHQDTKDVEIISRRAEYLNEEAEDVIVYQCPLDESLGRGHKTG